MDAVSMLQLIAAEHGEREVANPFVTGIGVFALLVLALWITTRLNRDR